jgi:hypothetical protein
MILLFALSTNAASNEPRSCNWLFQDEATKTVQKLLVKSQLGAKKMEEFNQVLRKHGLVDREIKLTDLREPQFVEQLKSSLDYILDIDPGRFEIAAQDLIQTGLIDFEVAHEEIKKIQATAYDIPNNGFPHIKFVFTRHLEKATIFAANGSVALHYMLISSFARMGMVYGEKPESLPRERDNFLLSLMKFNPRYDVLESAADLHHNPNGIISPEVALSVWKYLKVQGEDRYPFLDYLENPYSIFNPDHYALEARARALEELNHDPQNFRYEPLFRVMKDLYKVKIRN